MYLVRLLFCATIRLLLSLRYRVRLHGFDELKNVTGPTLILPSHPAYVDPMILFTTVWPRFQPRPLVAEDTFKIPFLWPIMKLVRAICVPDVTRVDAEARANANKAVETVIECLRRGENQLFWPSGRLERRGYEILGGARALTDVLKAVPEANVIMVRTRGLWGSSFSFAWTGKLPNLVNVFLGSLGWILARAFFFVPRRNVDITFRLLDRKDLPPLEREKINPWFEAWYNEPSHEKATFVPYHLFLDRREFEYPALAEVKEVDLDRVTAETKTAVAQLLAEKLNRPLADKRASAGRHARFARPRQPGPDGADARRRTPVRPLQRRCARERRPGLGARPGIDVRVGAAAGAEGVVRAAPSRHVGRDPRRDDRRRLRRPGAQESARCRHRRRSVRRSHLRTRPGRRADPGEAIRRASREERRPPDADLGRREHGAGRADRGRQGADRA